MGRSLFTIYKKDDDIVIFRRPWSPYFSIRNIYGTGIKLGNSGTISMYKPTIFG